MEAPVQALLPGTNNLSSGSGGDNVDSVADAAALATADGEEAALALVQDAELQRCSVILQDRWLSCVMINKCQETAADGEEAALALVQDAELQRCSPSHIKMVVTTRSQLVFWSRRSSSRRGRCAVLGCRTATCTHKC